MSCWLELVYPHPCLHVEEVTLGVLRRGVRVERWNRLRREKKEASSVRQSGIMLRRASLRRPAVLIAVELIHSP